MGAGQYAAGYYPAGFDPNTVTARKKVAQTDPVLFDLATHNTLRDADGLLKTIHWVDQAVALALGVDQGSFAAQSKLGNRLRRIKRSAGPTVAAQCRDAVENALSALLNRRDIAISKLAVDTAVRNRIVVTVAYVNLRLRAVNNKPAITNLQLAL